MHITLNNVGKRFNHEWIFRHVNYEFQTNRHYAVTGFNGSGKSTLLQIIAGAIMQNEGTLTYQSHQDTIDSHKLFSYISLAAPYLELIEELTADEFLNFHAGFKHLTLSNEEIFSLLSLNEASHKQIRFFSSGMKQRLKLAQAFFSDTPVLLLDEPCSNLDSKGIDLYLHLLEKFSANRITIICSNDKTEYQTCEEILSMEKFK